MLSSPTMLRKEHDVSKFDCGIEGKALSDWLKKHALQSQSAGQSRTIVVTENESTSVVGYYSFSIVSVEHAEDTPERVKRGLARHPIPVFLIARLARDVRYRNSQLGRRLLGDALRKAVLIAEDVPIRAIMVDALNEKAKSFYTEFDFVPFPEDSLRMWLLMKDLLKTLNSV